MNRVNFAHCSGVIIDVCRGHGSWFDKDELRKIIEFIRKGGMVAARQREIESLKAEQRRAANTQVAMGAPVSCDTCSHDIDMTELAVRGCLDVLELFLKM
jgi:Zn-finger nucleic acid-binding protein